MRKGCVRIDIIIGGRRSGKSTEAVNWLAGGKPLTGGIYDRVVVQPTKAMADAFTKLCQSHGLTTDLDKRVFARVTWSQRAVNAEVQVLYDEAQTYLPYDAAVITMTADGKLKALTNYTPPAV